jgi:Phosphodiester glycosidase
VNFAELHELNISINAIRGNKSLSFIKNPVFKIILPLFIILFISGCATTGLIEYNSIPGKITPLDDYTPLWLSIYPGIERSSYTQDSPPLAIEAIRVDLFNSDRKIIVTPGTYALEDDSTDQNFISSTVSSFLERNDCLVAINASPYEPFRLFEGSKQRAVGVVISNGILYSDNSEFDVFAIDTNKEVFLIEAPYSGNKYYDIEHAAGGFFIILRDGNNIGFRGNRNPISLVGVSGDKRYLFLVVIDGEDVKRSIGASLYEGAEWMKALGANDAMILDGGGSSSLVVRGEEGKSLLLNNPSGFNLFYIERPVAVHIGVK